MSGVFVGSIRQRAGEALPGYRWFVRPRYLLRLPRNVTTWPRREGQRFQEPFLLVRVRGGRCRWPVFERDRRKLQRCS